MVVSVIISALYARFLYERESLDRDRNLVQINDVYVPFLVSSLWGKNHDVMEKQMEGVVLFRHIDRIEIHDYDGYIFSAGKPARKSHDIITRDLVYSFKGKARTIGTMSLYLDRTGMQRDILQNTLSVFAVLLVLALVLSIAISFLYHGTIGRYLLQFARFIEKTDPGQPSLPFVPARRSGRKDELQTLVDHFNSMQDRINRYLVKMEEWQDLMQYIIHNDPNAIAVHDRDLRYVFVSDRYCRDYRIQEKDIIGRHHYEVFPEIPEKWRDIHQRALQGEVIRSEEDILHRADGTVDYTRWECRPWYLSDGSIGGIILYTEVITERKHTEAALRESEDRYRSLYQNAQVGLSRTRINDGKVLACNEKMAQIFGYEDILEFIEEYVLSEHYVDKNQRDLFLKELECFGAITNKETAFYKKDGEIIWVRFDTRIYPDKGYMEDVVIDLTEQKKAMETQQKLQAQLQQARKMEAVGRLAGGVAHDFNNMLGVILGNTEMAMENLSPDEPLYHALQEILNAARHSTDITRQLLAFARKQTIAPRVIDLNETVTGMLRMLRRLIGENIELVWLPEKDMWPVRMDPSQLDQILANLCLNARDAISGVGRLTIETGRITFDKVYCNDHPGFVPGDFVLLAVSDDGCGMDKDTLDNLFEPFFTTKDMGKGTGLGLATVYGIVKQNRGFINVYSEPGRGTTFRIYLARHDAPVDPVQETVPSIPDAQGSETILLVEDEPAILKMAERMLERFGYSVLAAGTPAQAMTLAGDHKGRIHLLMTDVVMPGMNGRELSEKLQDMYPEIKCLFMSGYTANVVAHHGVLDKDIAFIQKPFSARELARMVRGVLDSVTVLHGNS